MDTQINGTVLYNAFLSGAAEVKKARQYMNSINIFPVPDGDTGTNLDSMMQYIIDEAAAMGSPKETMEAIADAALVGARGNSGIIFAEYINGMSLEMDPDPVLSVDSFVRTMEKAVPYATKAISDPVDGTMITVMQQWAESLVKAMHLEEFGQMLEQAMQGAQRALVQTAMLNPFLRRDNVIDSGAKGFVCFLEGFVDYLRNGRAVEIPAEEGGPVHFDFVDTHDHGKEALAHRFCTEALVDSGIGLEESFREELAVFGESLIVAGNKRKTRIHIHTNDPMGLIRTVRQYGKITQQKIDDMVREHQVIHERKYPIALVVDSVADIPPELVEEYQMHVIPLQVIIDGSVYLDGLSIDADGYFQMANSVQEPPSSSLPNGKHIESTLWMLREFYDSILVMSISKALSGTYGAFEKVVSAMAAEGYPIDLIDTRLNSGAQGLVSVYAARLIAEGKPHGEIVRLVRDAVDRTSIFVSVSSLKPMIRSGRINRRVGSVLETLNLKPVISLDREGKGIVGDKAFSLKGSEQKVLTKLGKAVRETGVDAYNVVHGQGDGRVGGVVQRCIEITGKQPEYVTGVSTVIAVNAGENTVAVSFTTARGGDVVGTDH